MASENILRIII